MKAFFQKNTLSTKEARERLNNRLKGLELASIQNAASDTNHLYLSIFSNEHSQQYSLSLATENWVWKDIGGTEIPVLRTWVDRNSLHPTTVEIGRFLQNKLIINKIELDQESMLFRLHFENGCLLESRGICLSEDKPYYQLVLAGNNSYNNYNLLIKRDSCVEQIINGKEDGEYRVALFDLDYFREEHRHFTNHAIKQARQKKTPISFVQAKVIYLSLTTNGEFSFIPWRLRRSSNMTTRLDTIPTEELIAISRDECAKNNFTIEEAKRILESTIDSLREWLKIENNLEAIAKQEYINEAIFRDLVSWYDEVIA